MNGRSTDNYGGWCCTSGSAGRTSGGRSTLGAAPWGTSTREPLYAASACGAGSPLVLVERRGTPIVSGPIGQPRGQSPAALSAPCGRRRAYRTAHAEPGARNWTTETPWCWPGRRAIPVGSSGPWRSRTSSGFAKAATGPRRRPTSGPCRKCGPTRSASSEPPALAGGKGNCRPGWPSRAGW